MMNRFRNWAIILLIGAFAFVVGLCFLSSWVEKEKASKAPVKINSEASRARLNESTVVPDSPLRELYPAEFSTIENPHLRRFVDRRCNQSRVPPDISSQIPTVSLPREVDAVIGVLRDRLDDDSVRHEAAELLRRSEYNQLYQELFAILESSLESDRFRSWSAQHLGVLVNNDAVNSETKEVIAAKLNTVRVKDTGILLKRESLWALLCMHDPISVSETIRVLENPQSTDVRMLDLYVRGAHRLELKGSLVNIRKLASESKSEAVCLASIQALVHWNDQESIPSMKTLENSGSFPVRNAAHVALSKLGSK